LIENFALNKYNIYKLHHYHTFITSNFSHISTLHLGFNMLTLYFFGNVIENYFGRLHLMRLYIIGI